MLILPQKITDGGPTYAETYLTDHNHLIIEPWNAISSLAIAAPAVYFLWKIRKNPRQYGFLLAAIPFLLLNGIGSTLFHGFRSSSVLLMMDWMPAIILTLMVSVYFWSKVLPKPWMGFAAIPPIFLFRFGVASVFPGHLGMNISYIISGVAFLLPVLLILKKYRFEKSASIIFSTICFILAIYFRGADFEYTDYIPFGTHFLWHIFTGIGAYLLADYLYFLRNKELASLEIAKNAN